MAVLALVSYYGLLPQAFDVNTRGGKHVLLVLDYTCTVTPNGAQFIASGSCYCYK